MLYIQMETVVVTQLITVGVNSTIWGSQTD